jgi:hypothetical protein
MHRWATARYAIVVSGTESAADGPSPNLLRRMLWGFLLFFLSIGLFVAFLYGHSTSSEYEATTPTTATIDNCRESREAPDIIDCTGTWNLGGQRYHGDIDGVRNDVLPPGTAVDVRASRGRASTETYTTVHFFLPTYVVAGLLALAVVAFVVLERSRGQQGQRR